MPADLAAKERVRKLFEDAHEALSDLHLAWDAAWERGVPEGRLVQRGEGVSADVTWPSFSAALHLSLTATVQRQSEAADESAVAATGRPAREVP